MQFQNLERDTCLNNYIISHALKICDEEIVIWLQQIPTLQLMNTSAIGIKKSKKDVTLSKLLPLVRENG